MADILLRIFLILFVVGFSWSVIKLFKISVFMGILNLFVPFIPFLICLVRSFQELKLPFFMMFGSLLSIIVLFMINPELYDVYVQPLTNAVDKLTGQNPSAGYR